MTAKVIDTFTPWRSEYEAVMSIFERYLTLWVALCIVAGVALGHLAPGPRSPLLSGS